MMAATKGAPPHDWLGNTGGSIGIAMPLAVGAAVACPDRRVLCLTADGSGMYTLQALWTMAREGLKVTTVVFANRDYAVLKREFSYLVWVSRDRARWICSRSGVPISTGCSWRKAWVCPAARVTSLEGFCEGAAGGIGSRGPSLIEVPL